MQLNAIIEKAKLEQFHAVIGRTVPGATATVRLSRNGTGEPTHFGMGLNVTTAQYRKLALAGPASIKDLATIGQEPFWKMLETNNLKRVVTDGA